MDLENDEWLCYQKDYKTIELIINKEDDENEN
jgi:hypothetical protein